MGQKSFVFSAKFIFWICDWVSGTGLRASGCGGPELRRGWFCGLEFAAFPGGGLGDPSLAFQVPLAEPVGLRVGQTAQVASPRWLGDRR